MNKFIFQAYLDCPRHGLNDIKKRDDKMTEKKFHGRQLNREYVMVTLKRTGMNNRLVFRTAWARIYQIFRAGHSGYHPFTGKEVVHGRWISTIQKRKIARGL